MHSLLDWLALIAVLIALGEIAGLIGLIWLGRSISRQFRQHDHDLRAEVVQVNVNIAALIRAVRAVKGGLQMWRPYGEAICVDAVTPVPLDQNAPAGSKLDVQLLLIMPHWANSGRIYILSNSNTMVLVGLGVNLLAWLPPPSPQGIPPFIKLAIGVRPGMLYLLSEVPGDGGIISAYIAQ